jgi:hypothetical protein
VGRAVGQPADIAKTDQAILELFPDNEHLRRWITMAGERVAFQGLPARICWLGQGERDKAGVRFNDMVASGELEAPIVIGRDHLDTGSVASPYRETEGMLDGSDAIADWPLLNAMVNVASGASWVSIHHGGGVGIGRSIHAGQVSVADGTDLARRKLERVLTNDPAMGVIRHVDAGYDRAVEVADDEVSGSRCGSPDSGSATWSSKSAYRYGALSPGSRNRAIAWLRSLGPLGSIGRPTTSAKGRHDRVRGRHQAVSGRHRRRRQPVPADPEQPDHRVRRAVRLRQDHVAADDQPHDRADQRDDLDRRRGHQRQGRRHVARAGSGT